MDALQVNSSSDHPALTLNEQSNTLHRQVKNMRKYRKILRSAVSAIAHWYRRVKKMKEYRKIRLQRSATGIVLKPGMFLNWHQQQVQIVGFARLDNEAVIKAARELRKPGMGTCFNNGSYWEGGQVPKVLQKRLFCGFHYATHLNNGSHWEDENQETHVVVRVLSENVFRYVPCRLVEHRVELQAWRKKFFYQYRSSKHGLTSPSSKHVDVETTAKRWTRAEVVEVKRRGTSQELWVRWKDCIGQRSHKDMHSAKPTKIGARADASPMEILRHTFQQENKTKPTLDAIVHSLDNSRHANRTTIVHPKAGTTKWTRLTDVYPVGTFVPVATSTIKLLQPGNWIEFAHAKKGAPLHVQAAGKSLPTLIAQVYDLQHCTNTNTTTVRLLRRRLPAELEVTRSATGTTLVPFLKYTARNSFHVETVNLHEDNWSCFKLAHGVDVQSENEVDVFVAVLGAQNSMPSWTRATVKSLTLHPSPKLCLEIQPTEADQDNKGKKLSVNNVTAVTMAADPLLVARAGEYVKHCQVCQSNLATQLFTCHSHDQGSADNATEPDICDQCLTQYLTTAISSRTLCELVCPFTEKCAATMSLRSVRSFDRELGVAYEKKLKEIRRVANRLVASEDPQFAQWAESQGMKQCPRCFVRIEKNEGCDHMTCFSCGADFQWKSEGVKVVVVSPAERQAGRGRPAEQKREEDDTHRGETQRREGNRTEESTRRYRDTHRQRQQRRDTQAFQSLYEGWSVPTSEHLAVMRRLEHTQSSRSNGSSVRFQRSKSISNLELEKWREQTQKWMKKTGKIKNKKEQKKT